MEILKDIKDNSVTLMEVNQYAVCADLEKGMWKECKHKGTECPICSLPMVILVYGTSTSVFAFCDECKKYFVYTTKELEKKCLNIINTKEREFNGLIVRPIEQFGVTYESIIIPDGWRIPTTQEAIDLQPILFNK